MTPEIEQRLADFERRHKPDTTQYLALFREEIVALHFKGYTQKMAFHYVKEHGVSCSLRTFERWVKENIDFTTESVLSAASRTSSGVARSSATVAVLMDNKGASGINSTQRDAALALARERREEGFKNSVDRALEPARVGGDS